jgi:hypothetical protein
MEKFKKIILGIINIAQKLKKEKALPVLVWSLFPLVLLALLSSLLWLWPALLIIAIMVIQARRFQLALYAKIKN